MKTKTKKPNLRSFQVDFEVDDWKFIFPETVIVRAKTAEEAAYKALPAAKNGLRKQLAALAKRRTRICRANVNVFDAAEASAFKNDPGQHGDIKSEDFYMAL